MYHFVYMTAAESGKFYVGRHSTKNIYDGYQGSGKWVKQCKQNNTPLHTQILYFCENFDSLREKEQELINKYILDENCMNFSNSSCGFSIGELNPSKNPETIKKRPQNQKGVKTHFNCDNPSKKDTVKVLRKLRAIEMWNDLEYRESHSGVNHYMKQQKYKDNMKINNPMFTDNAKQKASDRCKTQFVDGTHNFQNPEFRNRALENNNMKNGRNPMFDPSISAKFKTPKEVVTCPHCNKSGGKPVMVRYHFDNCKLKSNK